MDFTKIPKALTVLDQWVCAEEGSKIPFMATEDKPASTTKPETWRSFDEATESVKDTNYDYIGFVFNDNGIVGIDIDTGYDDDGFLSDVSVDIINHCKSYTERSRSGRGFHILLFGDLPFKGKNNQKGVEIYKTGRYFITTGDVLDYTDIITNQDAIDYIVDKYFPDDIREINSNSSKVIYSPMFIRENGKFTSKAAFPPIPEGSRNLCLTSYGGQLNCQGRSKEEIYKELLRCNEEACNPKLSKAEIQSIVNSVCKYKRKRYE